MIAPVILVIDDDRDTRTILKTLFDRRGYSTAVAHDGHEAMQQMRDGLRPAVIILDLALGAFSGFAFREEQLKDSQLAAIPVIVQSGIYDVKAAAEQIGAVAYFHKPLDVEKMLATIPAHLAGK